MVINGKRCLEKRKQGRVSGVGLSSGTSCSEATLAVRLDSEEGSHVDFWEDWGRRNSQCKGAVKGPVRLEGARGRVGGEGREVRQCTGFGVRPPPPSPPAAR